MGFKKLAATAFSAVSDISKRSKDKLSMCL